MIGAEDYPFDASLRMHKMHSAQGLNRLRWIPERGHAQVMADLYETAMENERTGVSRRFEQSKRNELRHRLALVAEASQRGDHGDEARELAYKVLTCEPQEAGLEALEQFMRALQRLNIDVHNMPSRRGGGGRRRYNED